MNASRPREAALGAAAGLLAGLMLAVVLLGQGRLDSTQPLRLEAPAVGWLVFLALAATAGWVYGGLYRFQPGRLGAAVAGGLLFGHAFAG